MGGITVPETLAAADLLVAAFAATDTDGYFACFAAGATFVFHTDPRPVIVLEEYVRDWSDWTDSGWSVVSAESSDRRVDLHGDVAVFTHSVRTTSQDPSGVRTVEERETIVFSRGSDGRLLAVHEHLSAAPAEESDGVEKAARSGD
jgi:ketosteroid isomerase-like protein